MSDENEEQKVPLARLQSAINARKEVEAELKAAKAQIAELEPFKSRAEMAESQISELKEAHAADVARFEAREQFVTRGIDDGDTMDVLRSRWERLPKKDRPSLGEWLDGGAKEDKIASRLLPAKEAPAESAEPAEAEQAASQEAAAPRPTRTHNGTEAAPPPSTLLPRAEYQKRLAAARTPEQAREAMKLRFGE